MRTGIFTLAVTLAICSLGHADEPTPSTDSETESSLKALIERLEVRINELEAQVQQLKRVQQKSVIGGGMLEFLERPNGQALERPPQVDWGPLTKSIGETHVDRAGIIRDARGKPLGQWGVDFTTHDGRLGPNPSR